MGHYAIASMMICGTPRIAGGRWVLSASDAVWEPIRAIPDRLRQFLTDDVGNRDDLYAGRLQMTDPRLLEELENEGLFACFRSVEQSVLSKLDVLPPESIYASVASKLVRNGWDLCTGNGWLAASCHGLHPIDPFDGSELDANFEMINSYSLFDDPSNCEQYARKNDTELPEHAPWYRVGVLVPKDANRRLAATCGQKAG